MGREDTVAGVTPETDSAATMVSGADFLLRRTTVPFFGTLTAKSALARVSAKLRRDQAWEWTSVRHGTKHSVKSRKAG